MQIFQIYVCCYCWTRSKPVPWSLEYIAWVLCINVQLCLLWHGSEGNGAPSTLSHAPMNFSRNQAFSWGSYRLYTVPQTSINRGTVKPPYLGQCLELFIYYIFLVWNVLSILSFQNGWEANLNTWNGGWCVIIWPIKRVLLLTVISLF